MTTITVTPGAPASLAGLGRMLGNETAKGLRILWSHKIVLLPQLANMAVLYLMFQLVIGGGRLVDELLPATVVAFSIYVVSYIGLLKMVAGLMEEVNAGTLEQAHLSPLRAWHLSAGRLGAVLAEGLLTAVLLGAGFTLALGIDLPFEPAALVPIAVTLADIAGFILVIGGLALVVGSIGAIVHVINNLIMLVNGSVLPITALPPALETTAKFVPTTLGIDATRQVLFDQASLATLWTNGSLPWALLHAAVMLTVGWGTYQAAIRRGLRDGRLGP